MTPRAWAGLVAGLLLGPLGGSSQLLAETPAPDPCVAVTRAGFFADKVRLGRELGMRRTPEVKECLLQLLGHDSSWNREAAVAGLFALEDPAVVPLLIERMLTDHMIADDITKGFQSAPERYFVSLHEALLADGSAERRALLLTALATPGSSSGERLLRELSSDVDAPDRLAAFGLLASKYGADNDAFIRGFLADPALRGVALAFLVEHGTTQDLEIFAAAAASEDDHEAAAGLRGVARFGDAALKEQVIRQALDAPQGNRAPTALLLVTSVRSKGLQDRLCRAITGAGDVSTRMLAADYLAGFDDAAVVPCLIPALKEQYVAPQKGVADVVSSVLTAGVLGVLADTVSLFGKREFESRKRHVAERLPLLAGVDPGPTYEAWLDWAVCRGHNVDGVNLLQRLFSAERDRRQRAIGCACAFLGFPDEAGMRAANPGLPTDEEGLLLELARRLLDRGLLEEGP